MVEQARIVSPPTAAIPSRSCSLSYTALRMDLCSMSCNDNPLVVMRRGARHKARIGCHDEGVVTCVALTP
jgi:hypothetical protein